MRAQRRFRASIPEHECWTVPDAGLAGRKNGELLQAAERAGFDVLLTIDQGIAHQQNLRRRTIAVLLIRARSSKLDDLLPHGPACIRALRSIQAGQLIRIGNE